MWETFTVYSDEKSSFETEHPGDSWLVEAQAETYLEPDYHLLSTISLWRVVAEQSSAPDVGSISKSQNRRKLDQKSILKI